MKNTSLTKISGLITWRPSEETNGKIRFAIPNGDETLLDIDQLKKLHEFLTNIIQEHNSKNHV